MSLPPPGSAEGQEPEGAASEDKDGGATELRRSRPSALRVIASLLSAALLLVVVFWLADFDELHRRLSGARIDLIGLALVAYAGTYVARARRFAAAGARASTWVLFWVVTIHGAANRLMPLRTGELVYPIIARRVGAAPLGEGLVQILMLRIMDLLTVALLFLTALGLALLSGVSGMGQSTGAFVAAAAGLVLVSGLALAKLGRVLGLVVGIARRVFRNPESPVGKMLDKAEGAVVSVSALTVAGRLRIVFWSVMCWSAYFAMFQMILLALGVEIPLLRTVLGSSAAIVGSTVPISGVGTFGALEGGWTAGFVAVGIEPATAASTAIVMSGLSLAFAVLLAACGWVALGATGAGQKRAE